MDLFLDLIDHHILMLNLEELTFQNTTTVLFNLEIVFVRTAKNNDETLLMDSTVILIVFKSIVICIYLFLSLFM